MHKLFPSANESETQGKAVYVLEQIAKNYRLITDARNRENFIAKNTSPNEIPQHIFQKVYDQQKNANVYGVNSSNYLALANNGQAINRRKPSRLETMSLITIGGVFLISILISFQGITGFSILNESIAKPKISIIFLISGLILFFIIKRLAKTNFSARSSS